MTEKKRFYTIREVTRIFGVSERIIYRIEEEGLVRARRDEGSRKCFTPEDLEQIRLIVELSRELGVNWAGIEVILHMRERIIAMQREMQDIFDRLQPELKDSIAERRWERQRQSLPKMDLLRLLEEENSDPEAEA